MHWLAVTKSTIFVPLGFSSLSFSEKPPSHPPGLGEVLLCGPFASFILARSTSINNCLAFYTVGIFRGEQEISSTWHTADTQSVCRINAHVLQILTA